MMKFVKHVQDTKECALDTETTGLNRWKDHVVVWSACPSEDRRYCFTRAMLPIYNEELAKDTSLTWYFTNQTFDFCMLANSGVSPPMGDSYCTLAMDWLHNENRQGRHGLKETALDYTGAGMEEFNTAFPGLKEESTETRILRALDTDFRRAISYASDDAYATFRVFHILRDYLDKEEMVNGKSLWEYFQEVEMPFTRVLFNMIRRGIMIDTGYLEDLKPQLNSSIQQLERKLVKMAGQEINLKSTKQMSWLLFEKLGLKPISKTKKGGKPSTDEATLQRYADDGVEMCKEILKLRKLTKFNSTYVKGLSKWLDPEGRIHPTLTQHVAVTGRLCVAKGTMIDVVRDLSKQPQGVPIENVRVGDLVYTYDNDLRLTLKKVKWAGKTGTKAVVRVHWQGSGHKHRGHVDLTPNHEVRLTNGEYVRAKDLRSGDRVLALSRSMTSGYSRLHVTGDKELKEHQFVYEQTHKQNAEHVHHTNENKLDNRPSNLTGMSASKHTSLHNKAAMTIERRHAISRHTRKMWEDPNGPYKNRDYRGSKNPRYLSLEKPYIVQLLKQNGWSITKASHSSGIDFNTLKKYAIDHNIDLNEMKKRAKPKTWSTLRRSRQPRKYNHEILGLEYLPEEVDVYDLEIEETHNFIANQICVHNSSVDPNLQNVPRPDNDVFHIREAFIPKEGYTFCVFDYEQLEMRILAHISGEPNMIKVINNGWDIHTGTASLMYNYPYDDIIAAVKKKKAASKEGSNIKLTELELAMCFGRQASKTIGFGLLFGEGPKKLAHTLGVSVDEAKRLIEKYFAPYPGVRDHINAVHRQIRDECVYRTFLGRPRRFPELSQIGDRPYWDLTGSEKLAVSQSERQSVNFGTQGGAADILKRAMILCEFDPHLRDLGVEMLLQIHDELIFEVPIESVEEAMPIIKQLMEHPLGFELAVPLDCDGGVGNSWMSAKG
jgi:DNA polymerase I-like protein with 3'-5' exonuclease and polymerase domains